MNIRFVWIAAASCVAAVSTGCSGASDPSSSPQRVAQTWHVLAGSSSAQEAYQALAYYPSAIVIDAGDTISWSASPAEPHTVTFPAVGASPVPATDPSASQAAGGTSYDGTATTSSGFIAGGATYALTFTKPGTYTYYSLPQEPLVVGTVVVQAAGAHLPATQTQIDAAAKASIATDLGLAQRSVSTVPFATGSNTIAAGVSPSGSPPSDATVMRYLDGPSEMNDLPTTIKVGTTLRFENLSNNVPHTVTFPALGGTVPSGPPFQAATGGTTYDGSALVNSGVIPPGGSFSLTFTKPGTYPYECLFHNAAEGMVGTVTVTP